MKVQFVFTSNSGLDKSEGRLRFAIGFAVAAMAGACSSEGSSVAPGSRAESHEASDAGDAGQVLPGRQVVVEMKPGQRILLNLGSGRIASDAGAESGSWDLAFEGWDVFTNSGPSGPGNGAAFGPLEELAFLFDTAPEVPFLREDSTGGAFLDWYAYDGSAHQLWSRYHVFGVHSGEQLFKVQVMGYYGEQLGAPVSALYRLRFAEVTSSGSAETVDIVGLDATAGYPEIRDDAPSGCLKLSTGEQLELSPDQARSSGAWDLCFRRDVISVNGEEGGPGDVTAVELNAGDDATLEQLGELTEEQTLADFEAVDFERLSEPSLGYRGDHVVSAFDGAWVTNPGKQARAVAAAWYVRGGDGESEYLALVTDVEGVAESATRVTLQVKTLRDE